MLSQFILASQTVVALFMGLFEGLFIPQVPLENFYEWLDLWAPDLLSGIPDYISFESYWLELLHSSWIDFIGLSDLASLLAGLMTTPINYMLLLSPVILLLAIGLRVYRFVLDLIPFA